MRNWVWAVCAAAAFGPAAGARAQPNAPVDPLPQIAADPSADSPSGPKTRPVPQAPNGTLYDAATAADPLPVPATDAISHHARELWGCGPEFSTWLTGEWVIGTTRGPTLVPVVTTGPASAGTLAGSIGQPTTVPLFGGHPVLHDWRSGLRIEAGIWLDPDRQTALTARFYSLFSATEGFSARPDGAVVVNLPQFNGLGTGAVQTPLFVSYPGATTGTVQARARTSFAGGDLDVRQLLDRGDWYRIDLFAGYRQMHLGDELASSFDATPVLAPARTFGGDNVTTRNNFYGPQLGLCASTTWNRLSVEAHAASALGVTVSDLSFDRERSFPTNPAALAALGVPLAVTNRSPSPNIQNTLTYLGAVEECGVRMNWRATDRLRLTTGYSFIYWNNVRRAEEMFATGSVLRPRAVDFTTQLVSAGLDVRY